VKSAKGNPCLSPFICGSNRCPVVEPHAPTRSYIVWLMLILFVSAAWAQTPDRVTAAIDNSQFVTLNGGVSPRVRSSVDQGSVDPLFKLGSVRMTFRQTPEQQAALKQLLAGQQDPSSPNYHQWLTPEQFGDRFGLNQSDIARISHWLESEGFSIVEVARGRNWISFSGTAGQVQHTFHTQIHHVTRGGEEFFANVTEPSIPRALNGVVAGFLGLDNFKAKSTLVRPKARPAYTDAFGDTNLSPDDIATIYDLTPLYKGGIDGTGQKIAIIGRTDIHMSDIEQFRSAFGLSKNDPSDVLATGCVDPGYTTADDEMEADLDLEWSGAVARNASIIYVKCDANHNDIFGSLVYVINNNIAPVISMSFGGCEADQNANFESQYEPFLQQANTQGQTTMVSTGDSGSATCDGGSTTGVAVKGLSVNGLATPPEVTAVGGTEFNGDWNNTSQYWNSTNGSTLSSALSYIPELAWNDSSAGTDLQDGNLAGTGGGASIDFKKPSFQTGQGVPSDGARDIPDVAMPASPSHDGYILCTNASAPAGYTGTCASGIENAVENNSIVGGTSVSSPVFAGIVALLNQSLGNVPPKGLGDINPTLYAFAQSTPSAFHDVPAGNYGETGLPSGNVMPCQTGTPDCTSGTMGFLTTANYDLATGLGSVDGNVFVSRWPAAVSTKTATNTTADVNPSSISAGSTAGVTVSATVVPATGSGTPTGSVSFFNGTTQIGQAASLTSGKASVTYDTSKLPAGTDSITAVYSGDANFSTSTSPAVTLTVTPGSPSLTSTSTTLAITATPTSSQSDVGSSVTFTAVVSPGSGNAVPTGTVTFNNGSTALGTGTLSGGTATFSTSTLAANQYSVTAVYGGDSNFNGSTSTASPLDVVDFQIAANPATITVSSPGQSGNAVLTISPMAGFNQSVSLACSGLPTGANCSFASTSNGTTVTITTTGPTPSPLSQRASVTRGGPLFAILLPGLLGLAFSGARKRVLSAMRVLMVLGAFALTSLLVACGGFGGLGGIGGGGSSGGTPAGTTNVTITATAGQLSHQTTIQLVVQ
jgi:subtilase family serine protease